MLVSIYLRSIAICATYQINAAFIHDSPRFDLTNKPFLSTSSIITGLSLSACHSIPIPRMHSYTPLLCRCAFSRASDRLSLQSAKMFFLRSGRCFEYSLSYVLIHLNSYKLPDDTPEKYKRHNRYVFANRFGKKLTKS